MKPAIEFPIKCNTDFDFAEKLVSYYCFYFINEKSQYQGFTLNKTLVTALTVYVIYGFSKESKNMVKDILNYSNLSRVDSINKSLRDRGFLVKNNSGNEHHNEVNDDLKNISRLVNQIRESGIGLKKSGVKHIPIGVFLNLEL